MLKLTDRIRISWKNGRATAYALSGCLRRAEQCHCRRPQKPNQGGRQNLRGPPKAVWENPLVAKRTMTRYKIPVRGESYTHLGTGRKGANPAESSVINFIAGLLADQ